MGNDVRHEEGISCVVFNETCPACVPGCNRDSGAGCDHEPAPTSYSLSGNDGWVLLHSSAQVIFSVPPCDFVCSSSQGNGNFISDTLTQSGVLQPGQYTLFADASANGPEDLGPPGASASAQLSLTPVPLPASGVLLALGLVPLMLLCVRRKASSGASSLPFAAI